MKEQPLAYSEQRDVNGLGNFETNQPSPFSAGWYTPGEVIKFDTNSV